MKVYVFVDVTQPVTGLKQFPGVRHAAPQARQQLGGDRTGADRVHLKRLAKAVEKGIFLSPEGASVTAAYDRLLASGFLKMSDRVVLFNTGSGLKYTNVTAAAMGLERPAHEVQSV